MGNIGDSRCIACCSGLAEALSIDHKPGDSLERDRIENVSTLPTYILYIDYIITDHIQQWPFANISLLDKQYVNMGT